MWITPNWAQAVDGITRAFGMSEEKQKSAARTHSLVGKRTKTTLLIDKVIGVLAEGDASLNCLLNFYCDLAQVGLRELHTKPLITRLDDMTCRQIFFICWVLPMLESLEQQTKINQLKAPFIHDLTTLLSEYYYPKEDEQQCSVDAFLNRRIGQLLPRGTCTEFKQDIHKGNLRGLFSIDECAYRDKLSELREDLARTVSNEADTEMLIDKLRSLFKAGAILRSLEKWLGVFNPGNRLDNVSLARITQNLSQPDTTLFEKPQRFLSDFDVTVSIWLERLQHQRIPDSRSVDSFSIEERELFWPALLQRGIDDILLHSDLDFFLADIYAFCECWAPAWLKQNLDSQLLCELANNYDLQLLLTDEPSDLEPIVKKFEKAIFNALKKITVAMHQRQQLGHYGRRLASLLIATALGSENRITEHELTPLINVLIENLSADSRPFRPFSFATPFRQAVMAPLGEVPKSGAEIYKDDEAMIFAFAIAEYNKHLFSLYPAEPDPRYISYPFIKLDAILCDLFIFNPDLRAIDVDVVKKLFRREKIRIREGVKGSPCWHLSDAGPYTILRNLEMYLKQLALEHDGRVWLKPGIDRFYCLKPAEKRRVLRAIDEEAWRQELRLWWEGKKARRQGRISYEVNGERMLNLPAHFVSE